MRHIFLGLILVLTGALPVAWGQELTTQQVLAKLDEKAAVFTSLDASIAREQVSYGVKHPTATGKIYMKASKSGPMALLDITAPKAETMKALIRDGYAKAYFPTSNSYQNRKVDNNQIVQFLLIGFGSPSKNWSSSYSAAVAGREMIDKVNAVVLQLTSISSVTATFPKVTLWLDPQSWTPVRARLGKSSMDYTDFNYSNVKLNKGVSDATFDVKIPKDATKQ